MRNFIRGKFKIAAMLALLAGMATAGEAEKAAPSMDALAPRQASANKGKHGIYRSTTSHPGYDYWVYVPKKYSEENPAGIHLFFHGLGGSSTASQWMLWGPFLDANNCIGVHMIFEDLNPHKDAAGKAEAAMEAVEQTIADYKVVAGRGALVCFSAGGSPAGVLLNQYGRHAKHFDSAWPFHEVIVYGSCLKDGAGDNVDLPVSWCRCMGDGEEKMAPGLLSYMVKQMSQNLAVAAQNGGSPDIFLNYTKGRPHTILPEDIQRASAVFKRSDVAFAPFLCQSDFPEANLKPAVLLANDHHFGPAVEALNKIGGGKAAVILQKIGEEVGRMQNLIGTLSVQDPVLCDFYSDIFAKQLAGMPAQKNFQNILAAGKKERRTLWGQWAEGLQDAFDFKSATLKADKAPFFKMVIEKTGAESHLGLMAKKFLDFAPGAENSGPGHAGRAPKT